jgi:4-hydroxy-3-methylbut-2-en-1-yl diphosphate synthase IspG/GcpE
MHIGITEAIVKAARANASRIKTQVEIARSIGTSVRTSLDLS